MKCRVCGRPANPLYGGLCVPCLDLQDELDEERRARDAREPLEWGPEDEVRFGALS